MALETEGGFRDGDSGAPGVGGCQHGLLGKGGPLSPGVGVGLGNLVNRVVWSRLWVKGCMSVELLAAMAGSGLFQHPWFEPKSLRQGSLLGAW